MWCFSKQKTLKLNFSVQNADRTLLFQGGQMLWHFSLAIRKRTSWVWPVEWFFSTTKNWQSHWKIIRWVNIVIVTQKSKCCYLLTLFPKLYGFLSFKINHWVWPFTSKARKLQSDITNIFKVSPLVFQERKSYMFEIAWWGWVNNNNFHFPFKYMNKIAK